MVSSQDFPKQTNEFSETDVFLLFVVVLHQSSSGHFPCCCASWKFSSSDKWMYTCTHTYIHTYMHACMHACMHTYIHTCMHACMHTYTHTHIYIYSRRCIHYIYTCMYNYSYRGDIPTHQVDHYAYYPHLQPLRPATLMLHLGRCSPPSPSSVRPWLRRAGRSSWWRPSRRRWRSQSRPCPSLQRRRGQGGPVECRIEKSPMVFF